MLKRLKKSESKLVFHDFCYNTSLHGFKFIVHKTNICQQLLWIAICIVGLIFTMVLIYTQWRYFEENPITLNIETTHYPIAKVPFPSVTICNLDKVNLGKADKLLKLLLSKGFPLHLVEEFLLSMSTLIANRANTVKILTRKYSRVEYSSILNLLIKDFNYTIEDVMQEILQPCTEFITDCNWLDTSLNCSEIIHTTKSADGHCCSFNYHQFTPHSYTEEQIEEIKKNLIRVSGAGAYVALSLKLNYSLQAPKEVVMTPFYGARVFIHDWTTFPELRFQSVIAEEGQDIVVKVSPYVIESSGEVRDLDPGQRKCLFDNEIKPSVSFEYNYDSCLTECRINEINRRCKCNPFVYPNINNSTICGWDEFDCLTEHKHIFYSVQPPDGTPGFKPDITYGLICTCFPRCNQIKYNVDILVSSGGYPARQGSSAKASSDYKPNPTTISVYFQDLTCLQYKRNVYMTWSNLIASFGGIFGLCLGGSIISFIEVLFYFIKYNCWHSFASMENKTDKKVNDDIMKINVAPPPYILNKRLYPSRHIAPMKVFYP